MCIPTEITIGNFLGMGESSFLLVDFIVKRRRKPLKRSIPSTRYAWELFADD